MPEYTINITQECVEEIKNVKTLDELKEILIKISPSQDMIDRIKEIKEEFKHQSHDVVIENVPYTMIEREGLGPLFYINKETNTSVPAELMKRIIQQDYDADFVKRVLFDDAYFKMDPLDRGSMPFYFTRDEIRADILPLLKGGVLDEVFDLEVIDQISGEDLYRNHPIGECFQQGSQIYVPAEKMDDGSYRPRPDLIRPVSFEELPADMLIRLRANIYYWLVEADMKVGMSSIKIRALKMKNASFGADATRIHIEMVDKKCQTVHDAITWRNSVLYEAQYKESAKIPLPMNLS